MRRLVSFLALLTALAAIGCGGSASGAKPAETKSSAFPLTVEHRFGKTTVEAEPERVVVVGLTEQDVLYQLGIEPVGVTEWYGDHPYATWPWATAALGDSKPTVLKMTNGFAYETIASLRPDLIIGTNAGMKRADYKKLSRLAPTVASVKGGTDYFSKWDDQTKLVAAAVGKRAEGEQLVADTGAAYAKVAAEHPDFAGKTVTFAQNAFYDGLLYAYPAGVNTEFLTMLGFEINPKLTPLAEPGEQVGIAEERADVLDADEMVFATEKAADVSKLLAIPTISQLTALTGNRAVYTDATLSGAMYFMTPLSLEYVLERLPDQLQSALDGKAPRRMLGAS